jgi:anthranilate/para-aminobenzoate synthase component I
MFSYVRPTSGLTPVEAYIKLGGGKDSFLLESAGGLPGLCDYSFVGVDAKDTIVSDGENPIPTLRKTIMDYTSGITDTSLPLFGGAFGYLSYDVARYFENIPENTIDDLDIPESVFIVPSVLVVFSHCEGMVHIMADTSKHLNDVLSILNTPTPAMYSSDLPDTDGKVHANMTMDEYMDIVERAKEYIFAGDIFQSNLSVRFETSFPGKAFDLYLRLRDINPSPFAAFMDFGDFQLVSSSPERLVRLRDGKAETRPIAGTRRRGKDGGEDEHLTNDLLLNEKERAEHIMLVDLERNDIGRVSGYGSVRPTELMTIEKFSHVIHITSNIEGMLHDGKDQFDLLRAMFPGGTITGCPKVRCMEIIEELEPTRRGPYTGSIGYFGFNGNMDMNITIRTFLIKDGRAYVQAGAGIVADSDPRREYLESVSKANALFKALGLKERTDEWERLPT